MIFKRLMEIKENQLLLEKARTFLLQEILKELKGGKRNGKNKNKRNR